MGFFKDVVNVGRNLFPVWGGTNDPGVYKSILSEFRGDAVDPARADAERDRALQLQLREQDIALQREFAQNGIRWRVDDAKAAGLHPLAALGASGSSYSPTSVMLDPLPSEKPWQATLGQNIRSSIMSRLDPISLALSMKSIERAGLENDLLKLQIANYATNGPTGGSGDPYLSGQSSGLNQGSPSVVDEPLRRIVSDPRDLSKEAGAIQDYQIVKTNKGYAVVPGKNVKQAIEDSPMEYHWLARAGSRTYRHPETGEKMYMHPITGRLRPMRDWTGQKGWWRKAQNWKSLMRRR